MGAFQLVLNELKRKYSSQFTHVRYSEKYMYIHVLACKERKKDKQIKPILWPNVDNIVFLQTIY